MTDDERPAAKTTRRRGQALLDAIHEAVLLEVAETGPSGLTMEGIARRAGTAKTSLYRRWSTPEDILIEAIRHHYPQETPTAGADDLRGDLIAAIGLTRDLMGDRTLGRALLTVNAEATMRPELHRRMWAEVYEPLGGRFTQRVMEHYAALGHIDPARVNELTADIGESLMLKYAVDHPGELPPEGYERRIVDEVLLPVLGHPPGWSGAVGPTV
ncbi:TetR/AcrR family transcriptional regulator [Nocardiopsis sp. MG754419]|uniref:TetR/AcrR family transcriptional regulator n=1 Tax=Nocardiopsis sp. MG754419 TaxID=2259865 RepID=UPI001BA6CC6D|nr:TetR/AcrR family transcriptional regulator [Nocardiopsis sp. MG754419]MBR8745053.1 TetR family transcriptional regulator [Nocardiopsis sp. MG754419]